MLDSLRMSDGEQMEGTHPASTGGSPDAGEVKAPNVAPASVDPEQMSPMRPLLGMTAFALTLVVMIGLISAVGPVMLGLAIVGVLAGMTWVVVTVLRMTSDDEPEPTARDAAARRAPSRASEQRRTRSSRHARPLRAMLHH